MGKLVLVTGGAGLIGSHLCERLVRDGHTVISLDNYFAGSKENHVEGVEYREGHTKDIEIRIPETPDLIFHLGEYSRVEQSVFEPEVVHDLNVVGTAAVVEYWKKRKCKLVYAGSSTKFGDGGKARLTSPYASTKADNTELVKNTGDALNLPYAITYFYNVYGPRERAGAYGTVIEIFKQMYLRGAPLTVTAPGTQMRNFTHVYDIVDGLVLVGEKGTGDEYGLGNEKVFSILEVARLFGSEIIMLPERAGNRMTSALDTSKSRAIGWETERRLEDYVEEFLGTHPRVASLDDRVLVFSTTFHPVSGPAEDALVELMRALPGVSFDVITTRFTAESAATPSPVKNATVYRVGNGNYFDKYLFPLLGYLKAKELSRSHTYLFAWAIFASYAALAALLLKRIVRTPLLITLADQDLARAGGIKRTLLKTALSGADQVYGMASSDDRAAARLVQKSTLRQSMGDGDAFANQIRFAYANILASRLKK
jgi:UDP-glucose 4-epimerase